MVHAPPRFAKHADIAFDYAVDVEALDARTASSFIRSERDAALEQFIARTQTERAGALKTFAFRSLQRVLSDYDAYATLRMYRMHLLSTEQWASLLGRSPSSRAGSLLDVGAGDGGVTYFAKPLFESISVTESARGLQRVLRQKQWRVVDHDLGVEAWPDSERFDVISMLNVLDRTAYPRTLLRHARAALAPSGTLLLSVPLPLRPHVHVGASTVDPEESLPVTHAGFEASVQKLVDELLLPSGFEVSRWTRLPYVSHGDSQRALYVLDAAVFACVPRRA